MDAIQQHMIDSYRAAQRWEAPPPPPGRHDGSVLRAIRDHWRRTRPARPARPARPGGSGPSGA
ncbi:hypothetical protein ACFXPY_04225 [Streptomyces sp. NPDC059153]|uniref:hypothetical protein n=1 Tax=Streptomyces sp. NPDC059153 TaxID=3346743 RepID=UPI0036C66896